LFTNYKPLDFLCQSESQDLNQKYITKVVHPRQSAKQKTEAILLNPNHLDIILNYVYYVCLKSCLFSPRKRPRRGGERAFNIPTV